MSSLTSNRKGKPAPPRGPSFDADEPVAGCYLIWLRRDAPFTAIRIWFGPPLEPDTGEPMDRAPRWFATINGSAEVVPAERFWPQCAKHGISVAEYHRISRLARTLDSESPFYDTSRPIDRLKAPLPF